MVYSTRQPTSKFEGLLAGLKVIMQSQPGAQMDCTHDGHFLIGNVTDAFISRGMRDYLSGLGFSEDSDRGMFSFRVKNE